MPMICKSENPLMHTLFKDKYKIDTLNLLGPDNQNCLHYALSKGRFEMIKFALNNA